MADLGSVTMYIDVKTVDQGEIAAVECDRCAALVPSTRKAKHNRVCTATRVDDIVAALNQQAKAASIRSRAKE